MAGSIETDISDGIATITIDNRPKRNAISYRMLESLQANVEDLARRDEHYVVILRGAGGDVFSAGHDLSQERDPDRDGLWQDVAASIEQYAFPTIAMVNGDVYGGAVDLAMSCDMRIGHTEARIAITPAKLGIIYGPKPIVRLIDLVGVAKAKEMLYSANPMSAREAVRTGFYNRIYEPDDLEDETRGLAQDIASNAPLSLTYMHQIFERIARDRYVSQSTVEDGQELQRRAFDSNDHEEGVAAFSEGREPSFTGE